jgi:hypothetical protein
MARMAEHRIGGAVTGLLVLVLLTGCGPAPWNTGGGGGSDPTPSPAVTTRAAVPQPVANDLSSGSTQRTLTAGAVSATVDYWSTLSMDRWTATALKPVNLSMTTTVTPDDGKRVFLQRATMIAVPGNATTSFAPLAAQIDQAPTAPGYDVLSPQSYSQLFNVGEVPADATFVTLQFTYEYLMQTAPGSGDYAKQTGSDTLVVAIDQPASTSDE